MKYILVYGGGNAGQRHAKILQELGHEVLITDLLSEKPEESVGRWINLNDVQQNPQHIEGVVVATPPGTHWGIAQPYIDRGIPVFIEKPGGLNAFDHFNPQLVAVGFQLRAIPALRALCVRARQCDHAYVYDHQDMSTWPQATYQRDLLTEFSHEVDLACWFFGPIYAVKAQYLTATWLQVQLSALDGRHVTISLNSRHQGYARGISLTDGLEQELWTFTKEENEQAYKDQLVAWLNGTPFCTVRTVRHTHAVLGTIQQSLESKNCWCFVPTRHSSLAGYEEESRRPDGS